MVEKKADFSGSIPDHYDSIMGPAQFEAFAAELAGRVPPDPGAEVLEVASGTGRVTRHLRSRLQPERKLWATDISEAMLNHGRRQLGDETGIEWRVADATKLPFEDARFGAVVCAFGIMFFPDKAAGMREARRVLKQGGKYFFNVWDGVENNPHGKAAMEVIGALFPGDPIASFATIPYLFNDRSVISGMLAEAGFQVLRMEAVRKACECPSARLFATGQLRGTPRGLLLEERGVSLDSVIDKVAARLSQVGGAEPFRYNAQALVVEAHAR